MQRVRSTLAALVPVLVLTGLFFGSCQKNDTQVPISSGGDTRVSDFTFEMPVLTLDDYFGKTDTLGITITALDANLNPVSKAEVVLNVDNGPGQILLPNGTQTDDQGVLNAKYLVTLTGNTTAKISAQVGSGIPKKYQTVTMTSQDIRVTLTATPLTQEVTTGSDGQSTLRALVKNNQGVTIPGVPVHLQLIDGAGTLSSVSYDNTTYAYSSTLTVDAVEDVVNTRVRAYIDVTAPEDTTGGTLSAKGTPASPNGSLKGKGTIAGNVDRGIAESTVADTVTVTFTPLNTRVSSIFVRVSPDQIVVAPDSSGTATVTAVAMDEYNNGISDLQLYFRLRSLSEGQLAGTVSSPLPTDANGVTTAEISTNGQYGTWVVEARTTQNSTTFFSDTLHVLSGSPQGITVNADTTQIAVYGTNGIESTQIHAVVRDQNNQPVQDGTVVYFLMESFPWQEGDAARIKMNENDGWHSPFPDPNPEHTDPEYGLPYDSVMTYGGAATVRVTSGVRTGVVSMRVWTYLDDAHTDSIGATFRGLQVVSGPPDHIEVDFNPQGQDGGGAIWNLTVSARVQDALNNEVADGYAVAFSVDPDFAHIGDGITGNTAQTGESQPGVAYTILRYHSRYTNQQVQLFASVLRGDNVTISDNYTVDHLPIQQASGTLTSDLTNFDYTRHVGPGDPAYAVFTLTLRVYDGHEHLIDGQEVRFGPQKGRIYSSPVYLPQLDPSPYGVTGPTDIDGSPDDDAEGCATRYLILSEAEAFPDPMVPETTVTVTADIIGAPDASIEPIVLFLIH